ncbi:hypothetical protein PHMEG_00032516 [Phytophthora megakarya]|uniref:Uncharacterized protein n=1 Tax=Phytophthora megakarya TaxID=4795 RepID=A0A225UW84_9STRA|nr:hypothetical protein PHMEG_00032516 [Phytophthora megakarya]
MLLFKAADTEKHKGHVDSGGPRHKAPELDDTGEFVRWLCCGSTNRNIFGCSASRDEESLAARSRELTLGLSDTTPKLLAAKFRTDDSEDEDTTFSIYDRGVLGTHRDKGEDGGCRVRWRGWEAYTNNYEVPCNRWINLKNVPPIWKPISETSTSFCGTSTPTKRSIVLLANFYDGAHCDVGVASPKSFENLLLTAVQSGDICVQIEYAAEFSVQRTHDHVCRSQVEYEQKSSALIASIEQMSPLLNVVVNPEGARLPSGYFEITMELTRAAGRNSVVVVLHSMNATGCFPNLEDVKRKIESIVLFEAKRSPGEEIQIQAFRHLLALAGLTRHNRERTFMESVINRKLVLTERKVAAEFEKIGFCFASTELQDVVSYLKRIQDNYARAHNHRMNDLPSLSMLSPTPRGLYTLPFMNTLLVSSTMTCESGEPRSPWRFVCVLVDYDFQLVDFVHDGCPVTKRGGISYRQGQSINNSFVDRVYLRLTSLSNKKITEDENSDFVDENFTKTSQFLSGVRIQLENVEERHILGMFDAKIIAGCRCVSLKEK